MKITTIPLALLSSLLLINSVCAFKLSLKSTDNIAAQIVTQKPEGPAIPYSDAKAKEYAYYSMITHCTDSQITNWNCKLCKSNILTDVALIQNSTYDIAGYVGYSKTHNQVIVSWRGTVDTKNWEVDFRYKLTKYTPRSGVCTDCQIHTGILQAYRSVENQVSTHVKSLLAKYATASITSTGHSLGGGLSLLTNLELQIAFPNKISYTYNYGCLRIGNGNFVNFLKSKITSIYRVVHNKDPVPHVPPFDFGYIHPANEIFYNEDMSSFTVCNDSGQDKACSDKLVPYLDPKDHTFYFVNTDSSVC